ncbi:hypothetical protein F444_03084 [Phytophthora nicotianae P1976]|uniref:Uncharacterized protein n=1 Tax=Phytophthora nicotianae P1976 TaxID=1317066 RepID=A0A081AVB6_PHYNI|nr:hypothetical protein F444_03084 [Phytophthora nicotianae P1976]
MAAQDATDSVTWLVMSNRRDGGSLSYSVLNTHRWELFNLFRDYGHIISKMLESELINYSINTGKDPLMFDVSFFARMALYHTGNLLTHTWRLLNQRQEDWMSRRASLYHEPGTIVSKLSAK